MNVAVVPPKIDMFKSNDSTAIHIFHFPARNPFGVFVSRNCKSFWDQFLEKNTPPFKIVFDLRNISLITRLEAECLIAIGLAFADTGLPITLSNVDHSLEDLLYDLNFQSIFAIQLSK